jgi:hypothetical protein
MKERLVSPIVIWVRAELLIPTVVGMDPAGYIILRVWW